MPAVDPLFHLIGIDASMLTHQEKFLVELELFSRICEELKEIFREQHRNYFNLMKFTIEKENNMLESRHVQFIINDILSTGEYNLKGIAYYTNTFEDVVMESMTGLNACPSAIFLRKLIDLHRSVRRDLYDMMMKRIIAKFLSEQGKQVQNIA